MVPDRRRAEIGFLIGFCIAFLTARRLGRPKPADDPDSLLTKAQQEMKEVQARNRERAVQAITQKNNLQAQVDKTQKLVDHYQEKVEFARWKGDEAMAQSLLSEKVAYEQTLARLTEMLQSALETVEQIKAAIKREQERVREKTAEAMALKVRWQQAQRDLIRDPISLAQAERLFDQAEAQIRAAEARREVLTRLAHLQNTRDELGRQARLALDAGDRDLARDLMHERGVLEDTLAEIAKNLRQLTPRRV